MIHKPTALAFGLLLSAAAAFAHSDTFKPAFVGALVDPYLSIQQGLSGDDLSAAKAGAQAYQNRSKPILRIDDVTLRQHPKTSRRD